MTEVMNKNTMNKNTELFEKNGKKHLAGDFLIEVSKTLPLNEENIRDILRNTPNEGRGHTNMMNLISSICLYFQDITKVPPLARETIRKKIYYLDWVIQLRISKKELNSGMKKLRNMGFYPQHTQITEKDLFDAHRSKIRTDLHLSETVVDYAHNLLEESRRKGIAIRHDPIARIYAMVYAASKL